MTACQPIVGGDRDSHGCIPSAGYRWCPSSEKCQRMWEVYCPEYKEQFKEELVVDFESCAKAGLPVLESHPRQCRFKDTTYTEKIECTEGKWCEYEKKCVKPEDCKCGGIAGFGCPYEYNCKYKEGYPDELGICE